MFRELVELARDLDTQGKLPPVGYYYYGQPIKWIVHIWPDRVYIEESDLEKARPYSGRTSDVQAHILADEAGYALGVSKDKTGTGDRRSKEKHKAFRELIHKFLRWEGVTDQALRTAIGWLENILQNNLPQKDPRFQDVLTKDWVSFLLEEGSLAGQHLFEHPEVKAFWITEMQERSAPGDKNNKKLVIGECSVCGQSNVPLVGKIPLGVKLAGTVPLHSYNNSAFPSFQSGSEPQKSTHLGLCFTCGDSAARAFNYLSNSDKHKKSIVWDKDKRDSLVNQTALFWLKSPGDSMIEAGETVLDMEELLAPIGNALAEERTKEGTPPPELGQLSALLNLPWKPTEAGLTLSDFAFYLGILSPNVGRIALREWISVSLADLKQNLREFHKATRIVSSWGDPATPHSISRILGASAIENPNYNRGLIRSAFLGYKPPIGLLEAAVKRIRNPDILQDAKEAWRLQSLAAAIKLQLTFGKEEEMEELNPQRRTQAYLSGRLLAVLEEAQLRASDFKINTTLVDRFYGSASTAPASVFGNLLRLATIAHLPEVGKTLNELIEEVMSHLDEVGGFKKTHTLSEQAEFALGFYHQRAHFRAGRGKNKNKEGQQ